MTVIATAGHVDHGKSTLVKSLTGTDPDRWDEEKARGLTIDLGFATCRLPSGRDLSFVDVPGHTRFLRNMLAGVGAVEGCVFVVAATEGWKEQSEEHLRILDLLGIRHGIVALTKLDLVDDDLLELAMLDVEEHVEGTFLEGAPVIPVAATVGTGLPELAEAIDTLIDEMGPERDLDRPRLWVDRAFSSSGAGTVVTGTLTGGTIAAGEDLYAMPGANGARIRGLQSHHRSVSSIGPGNRVAINLTGIDHSDLRRGDVMIRQGQWHDSAMVDAELTVLASLKHDVSRRGAYAVYLGSGEFSAKVRVLGPDVLPPGTSGSVRLYLDRPIPVLPGDRYVLRERGRDETVGGGQILDIDPQLPASKATPDRDVDRMVRERGWVEADHLSKLLGEPVEPTLGRWLVDPAVLVETTERVRAAIADAGPLGLDIASFDEHERAVIATQPDLHIDQSRITVGEVRDPLADHPWITDLEADPFSPPGPDGVDRGEVRELVRRGLVVEQDKVFFAASSIDKAARLVAGKLAEQPEGITVAEVRDLLNTSRKFVLPILAYLDGNGMTRRREDLRIAGPRLPEPD